MASPNFDDMPALEAEPLLFSLTSLSEAAAAAERAPGGKKRGKKRTREEADEEESEEDEESDDDEDDDSLMDELNEAGAATTPISLDESKQSPTPSGRVPRIKKSAVSADPDGIAPARFPIIHTVHASAWLGREVDVKKIAQRCINAAYVPPSGVRMTIRNPVGTVMVHASGKYVCMGGKSTLDMVTIARKVARKIQRMGNLEGTKDYQNIGFHNFNINNFAASGAFGYRLNLRALAEDPAFMDYVEYEQEQWKGLHYRLPVDPEKTLADLIPSYAFLAAQRNRTEQFSTDEFLQQGEHAISTKGQLNYYANTGGMGNKSSTTAAAAKKFPAKVPPSLHGQILTATIYANGRLTLTGVRKEKDIHDGYLRLWHLLRPFATTQPPQQPPSPPPYPRIFLPGQRAQIKAEKIAAGIDPATLAAASAASTRARLPDIKPNILLSTSTTSSPMFTLPTLASGSLVKTEALVGTFASATSAIKTEVKPDPHPDQGRDSASAIIIEGLPLETGTGAEEEDVEWE